MGTYLSLFKTKIVNQTTKKLISAKIVKEFSKPETSNEKCNELLMLAWHFNIPQLEEMMSCFNLNNQIDTILWKA